MDKLIQFKISHAELSERVKEIQDFSTSASTQCDAQQDMDLREPEGDAVHIETQTQTVAPVVEKINIGVQVDEVYT